ncbi:MAG: phosphotransferase, partial [Deltaproteobacteria bacterium]|nr:phosphotransferase [Deltaproteobacteria bacterium]
IGEALLLSILGEKVKIRQFEALQQSLSQSNLKISPDHLEMSSYWGTRSGCNITRVGSDGRNEDVAKPEQEGIFKSGNPRKILQEKKNIETWGGILPDLVPRIYAYQEDHSSASLLIEFISGPTLEAMIISHSPVELNEALDHLKKTLRMIWDKTIEYKPRPIDYMEQLQRRLDAIREVHPDFFREEQKLNNLNLSSTEQLIERCRLQEAEIKAPFTVFGHGDFNINNILFNNQKQRIHFIDLYRSHRADYLEDIAVIMVSNFRLPLFDPVLRARLNLVIRELFLFSRNYAASMKDQTFALRLALALARSFYTSTRFELNVKLAREMALRAIFLLESVAYHHEHKLDRKDFSLAEDILYFG